MDIIDERPLIMGRISGEPIPGAPPAATPTPVSAPTTSQSETQAEIDKIFANPHRTQADSERAVDLIRQQLGPVGIQIVYQTGPPPSPPDAVVSSDPAAPAEVVPVPTEASVLNTMAAESLVEAAPVLGERLGIVLEPERVQTIVASLVPRPDGFPMRLDDELQHYDEGARNELEELHTLGWNAFKNTQAFPLSAEAIEDRHGFRFSRKPFEFFVWLGSLIRERQDQRR